MGPERPPATSGEPLVGWRTGAFLVLALATGSGLLVGHHLRWGARTTDPLRELVAALHAGDDAAAYALMSARYRREHTDAEFRRAVAAMSELRSAEGVVLERPTLWEWTAPSNPDRLCGVLRGLSPPSRVAATVVEEGGRFAIDALWVDDRPLDPSAPTPRARCTPTQSAARGRHAPLP